MVTVATYNLENLFSRPKAFNTGSWAEGEKILAAYREFNTLIAADTYSDTDVAKMRELLVELGVYYRNTHGAIRRRLTQNPGLGVAAEEPWQLRHRTPRHQQGRADHRHRAGRLDRLARTGHRGDRRDRHPADRPGHR